MSKKIATLIGLGLMGGSIALALRKKSPSTQIFAVSRSSQKILKARREGFIDQGSTQLKNIPRNSDLIIVCTPVPQIVPAVIAFDRIFETPALVTDVGSTKEKMILDLKRARLRHVRFVGSHPMAGDHQTGMAFARADLYENALVFVTQDQASRTDLGKVEKFWSGLGANRLITLPAKDHDRIVGEVSHLPHLVASALTLAGRPTNLLLSGPGFRDATRIAQGDPDLWLGIIASNKYLPRQLERFEKEVRKVRTLIEQRQWSTLRRLLAEASRRRRALS